jgi:hypothetical protein
VFVNVANRFFLMEHHTAIPLPQFSDTTFRLACRWMDKTDWAKNAI